MRLFKAALASLLLMLPIPAMAQPVQNEVDLAEVFGSAERCEAAVTSGASFEREDSTSRLVSWNIRWFPKGNPEGEGGGTDLDWLACTLAYLQPDIVAFQESLASREADVAWAAVGDRLASYIAGDWRVDMQDCGGEGSQHVGFLYNADFYALRHAHDAWQLNGASTDADHPCAGNLRPGRAGFFIAGGDGADFHIASVHSDSGTNQRDYDHRQTALGRLDGLFVEMNALQPDKDMILLGDFNTMGVDGGRSGEAEVLGLEFTAAAEAPGFRLLVPDLPCTEYYNNRCGHLDHVLVTRAMEEARTSRVTMSGYCAVLKGERIRGGDPAAYTGISDHCPLVVDIRAEDLD